MPPGNNIASVYRLRVEGAGLGGGAIIFENETILEFSQQFLSVSISTNRAIYTGGQEVKIRAIMLTTALQPYTGIADLFIIDPDGIVRFSMVTDLNVGRNPKEVLRVLDALQTDELCPCNWSQGEETIDLHAATSQ